LTQEAQFLMRQQISRTRPFKGNGYSSCMKGLRYSLDNRIGDGLFSVRSEELKADCHTADILIHDSHYRPEEILEHRGWGHSDYRSALDLALKANVEKLILFHHAPEARDGDVMEIAGLGEAFSKEENSNLKIEGGAKENSVP